MLPALGAYLGHVSLVSTENYLSVTPERFSKQLLRLSSASVEFKSSSNFRARLVARPNDKTNVDSCQIMR